MPFRFSLAAVLRLRDTQTRQEEVRLEAISQQLSAVRREFEVLQTRRQEFERLLAAEMTHGAPAGDMQLRMVGRRALIEAAHRLNQAIAGLERTWKQQQQRFNEARQRQEVIESVRQRQLDAYKEDQRRREQQMIDDLFLSRRKR